MNQREVLAELAAQSSSGPTTADKAYLRTAINHHQALADASKKHAAGSGHSPRVRKLAAKLHAKHSTNLGLLQSVLADTGTSEPDPAQRLA